MNGAPLVELIDNGASVDVYPNKKAVNKYLKFYPMIEKDKAVTKFQKKLSKVISIVVENDVVKIAQ